MENKEQKPSVFDYTEYRTFLEDSYKFFRKTKPFFSYRYIAQYAGASSPGWFPNLLRGRINLTSIYIVKIIQLLKMNSREAEYFELLVSYNQAGNPDEKEHYLEKIISIRGIEPILVLAKDFEYLSKWYTSAIRELLLVNRLRDNCDKIASMFIPPLSIDEAREAIDILKKTDLVHTDIHGHLVPRNSIIKKDPSVKSTKWKKFMKEKINLGIKAIDHFPKEQRDISEVCIPLSENGFAEAKEEVDKLRKKLLVLSEKDKSHNRVFQCNIQLFPLTVKFDAEN
ncbi:MAG: TIGR02147 family protein [Fibrobacter sp.]|nr:TIGR02147 family protein [Fibrobacter sp.]